MIITYHFLRWIIEKRAVNGGERWGERERAIIMTDTKKDRKDRATWINKVLHSLSCFLILNLFAFSCVFCCYFVLLSFSWRVSFEVFWRCFSGAYLLECAMTELGWFWWRKNWSIYLIDLMKSGAKTAITSFVDENFGIWFARLCLL